LLIITYVFSSTKSENKVAEQVLPASEVGREVAQTIYTHVSKCENDKMEKKRKKLQPGCASQILTC
jgi:hypothetical protein